jgi:hypothetical protein
MADDESTLTYGPDDSLTGSSGFPSIPALTIIWHPDLDRVGQIAPLTSLLESGVVHLSRDQPIFLPPGSTAGEPLDHRGISLQLEASISKRGISAALGATVFPRKKPASREVVPRTRRAFHVRDVAL